MLLHYGQLSICNLSASVINPTYWLGVPNYPALKEAQGINGAL